MRTLHLKSADEGGDMTPMIDLVFLLIAFFAILLNFSETEQNQRIKLPSSDLAMPPQAPPESHITIQVTKDGDIIIKGKDYLPEDLVPYLKLEKEYTMSLPDTDFHDTQIIIRADAFVETQTVQDVMKKCQEVGYDKFSLRAKQEQSSGFKGTQLPES